MRNCCDGHYVFGRGYHSVECKSKIKPKRIDTKTEYGFIKVDNKKGAIII